MKKIVNVLFLGLLLTSGKSIAQIVSTSIFLQGAYLEVGMQRNAAMGSGGSGSTIPSTYHPGGTFSPCSVRSIASVYDWGKDGWGAGTPTFMGDYTLPGSPWEGWAVEANGTVGYAYSTSCAFSGGGSLTGNHTTHTASGGRQTGIWDGTFLSGALAIQKEHRIDTFGSAFIVTVKFTNTSTSTISDVYYIRTCDPDNNQRLSGGSFSTINTIPYQTLLTPDPYNRVMVQATSTGSASATGTPPTSLSLTTKDCRAKALVYTSWPLSTASSLPLRNVWSGTGIGGLGTAYYTTSTRVTSDIAIGLVFNIGNIAAGDSAVISYAYVYDGTIGVDSAFPEPKMVVQGVAYDSVDTVTSCMLTSGTSLPVDIINATDRHWTWSDWTWAPSTGLSTTTGTSSVVDFTAITTVTTYTITGTDSAMGSCAQKTFLLTVIPVTVATPIPRDTTYCLGVTPPDLSYNVTGTFLNYYTSATGGTGTTVPPVPSTASIGTTTYYVSQIVTGCASTRVPLNITVVDPPSIFLSNNGPLCPGDRLNITLTDTTGATGVTFTWSGPGGYTATTQNVNIFSATAADSGVYTVVANINGCATYPTSNTVIVRNTPPSPVYSNPTYCQYLSSVPLSAAGSNILWYTSATGGIGSTVAPTPSTTVAGTFTWYVTQTVNGCQSARYPVIVTVNPKPAPPTVTNNPGSYCPGATFVASTFAAGTGSTLWYSTPTGGTGSSTEPVISTTFPGSFTNYVSQTLLGCESDRSPLTITIYDTVRARYSANVDWGCDADTVSFTNTSYGAINYRWEFGDGTSSITANPSHIYNRQSVYIVKLFAHSAYCVDSLISTIDLNHPNNASFTLSPSVVCQGSPVTFKNTTVALPSGASYTWHFGDGATSRLDSAIHSYKKTGTYRVMLVSKDFVPCLDTAYGTVTVDSMSDLNLDFSDTAICRGAYVTLDADFSSIGNTEFIWDFGNNDSVRNINPVVYAYPAAGTYTVTATARYRVCNNISKSRTIFVGNTPNIDLGPDTLICSGSTSIILADLINGAAGSGFSWRWGTGERSASIAVTSAGVFYATVTKDGCSATDSVIVSDDCYLKFPTCFTPNLDGLNDYFNPRDFMLKGLKTFKMSIYNRWGQLIFESSNISGKGWDGNFNDVPQPTGVYIYQVEATFNDGQRLNKHGNITLLK